MRIKYFSFLSFYLIACINVAYAAGNDYEVTFARVSNNINTHSAGCLIVHSNNTNEKNVYCRYQLDKKANFLRDDDERTNSLWKSENIEKFQENIINWFYNTYEIILPTEEVSYMAYKMSSTTVSIFLPILEVKLSQYVITDRSFAISVHNKLRRENLTKNAEGITFVRIYDESKGKRADCLTFSSNTKNIYCRYGNYNVNFWIDDNKEEGIFLKISSDIKTFQQNIIGWFQRKYHFASPTQQEVAYIAYRMSGYEVSKFFPTQIITLKRQYETEQELAEAVHRRLLMGEEETISTHIAEEKSFYTKKPTKQLDSKKDEPSKNLIDIGKILVLLALIFGALFFFFPYLLKRESERFYEDILHYKFEYIGNSFHRENRLLMEKIEKIDHNEAVIQLKQERENNHLLKEQLNNTLQIFQNLSNHFHLKSEIGRFFKKRQNGVQRWLQSALLGELLIFESIIKQIESNGDETDQRILEVLYLNSAATEHSIMRYWDKAVAQYFDSDDKLWNHLFALDGGFWLNNLLRANDILQAYFSDRDSLKKLSQQLLHVRNILEMAFQEMGIELISPRIFEEKPTYITTRSRNSFDPYLEEVAASKIGPQLKMNPYIIVDIHRYGFESKNNPNAENDVCVVVMTPSQWKA